MAKWFLCYQDDDDDDDASGFIVHHGVFVEATTDNAILVLREAIIQHGRPGIRSN